MILPTMFLRARTATLAACLTLTLSACATSADVSVIRPQLPAPPDWAKAVSATEPKTGEDALVVAARERGGRIRANAVITNFHGWYESVRAGYAGDVK